MKKKKVGRPSKLSNRVIEQVELLAGFELTEEEIGQVLGVTRLTINNWKTNKEFLYALKKGKATLDAKVVKSLVKRALGYSYKEITRELKDGKITVTKIIDKFLAPDTTAMIFWLKNRRKDLWREVTPVGETNIRAIIFNLQSSPELLNQEEKTFVENYANSKR